MRTTRRLRLLRVVVTALAIVGMFAAAAALATPSDGTNIETEAGAARPDHARVKDRKDKEDRQNKGDRGRGRKVRTGDGVIVVDVDEDTTDSTVDHGSTEGTTQGTTDGSTDGTTGAIRDDTSTGGDSTAITTDGDQATTTVAGQASTTMAGGTVSTTTTGSSSQSTTTTTAPGSGGGSGGGGGNLSAPIRAAFFYPWFPNAWRQGGIDPFTNFTPSLGRYSSSDPNTIRQQLDLADDAHIDAFIASWWGIGHHTDEAMPALLNTTTSSGSPHPGLKWTIYYEPEGYGDPSASELVADLRYLSANYFNHPSYLSIDGKPVVFVWAESSDGAGMAQRWADAKAQFGSNLHVVLKVYSGYRSTNPQPDSWHQYGPAVAYSEHAPHSATVSPGFWLAGQNPRLERDLARFEQDVVRMNNAGTFWQLITSWNEWGEGTSIEPATEFGAGYINALAQHPPNKS